MYFTSLILAFKTTFCYASSAEENDQLISPFVVIFKFWPVYGFHQDSPSKRRKRTKKAKPLHFVIPDEVAATRAGCEKKAEMSDKVTAIGNYVKEILNELKVRTVFVNFCFEIMKW